MTTQQTDERRCAKCGLRSPHDVCPTLPSGRLMGEFISNYGVDVDGAGEYGAYVGYGHDFGPDECNPNEGSK